MQGCRRFMLLAGFGLTALVGGCQGMGESASSSDRGPSPTFGQNYVPPQSEPPVEDADTGRKTAARSAASAAGDDSAENESAGAGRRRPRWLGGSDQEPALRKTIPVSARTDSQADDDLDR